MLGPTGGGRGYSPREARGGGSEGGGQFPLTGPIGGRGVGGRGYSPREPRGGGGRHGEGAWMHVRNNNNDPGGGGRHEEGGRMHARNNNNGGPWDHHQDDHGHREQEAGVSPPFLCVASLPSC
jgi:hypothetical protein